MNCPECNETLGCGVCGHEPDTPSLEVLRPFLWSEEMSTAWHRAIPDVPKAFDDLIDAYRKHGGRK